MTPLEPHSQGVVIRVKARPGARRNALAGLHDGALRIDVAAAPEKGKANQAIVSMLAETFGVAKSAIELISSPANPQKRFLIGSVELATAARRLAELLSTDEEPPRKPRATRRGEEESGTADER